MLKLAPRMALAVGMVATFLGTPAEGGIMIINDEREVSGTGSTRHLFSGTITDSYSFGDTCTAPTLEFHPAFSDSAGTSGGGPTGFAFSSVRQDSIVDSDSATYSSLLGLFVDRSSSFSAESRASTASSFHLEFAVPEVLLYNLTFDLDFGGSQSTPHSIPITWSYSFSSANLGVIEAQTITMGRNFAGPSGPPGYVQFNYAGELDPSDIYTIDFSQEIEATAISDVTSAQMKSSFTLTMVPEPASGVFWGLSLLGFYGSMRRRVQIRSVR